MAGEPNGNNTASPGWTLNLLAVEHPACATETGFYFNANGTIHFAPGQTFPGTGDGTITGVTAGTDLTGGGTSGNVTLKLDTTKIPSLAATNSFTGNANHSQRRPQPAGHNQRLQRSHQYRRRALPARIQERFDKCLCGWSGQLYDHRERITKGSGHSVLKALTSGNFNTGERRFRVGANTTGSDNAAFGANALLMNTTGVREYRNRRRCPASTSTGSNNTAVGIEALFNNFTGSNNTAIGAFTGTGQAEGLTNTTAIGYSSTVQQNNSLVLGMAQAGAPGAQFVNVGIGTASQYRLWRRR